MRQSVKFSLEKLRFDKLMGFLDEQFQVFPDERASNAKYPLASVVKAAFAMFSLKSPSLLNFKKQTAAEQHNLRSIYQIEGEIPCDNQMRVILDVLEPSWIRSIFASVFRLLEQAGVIKEYQFWDKAIIVSVDGVEHFSSQKVHCPSCTTKRLRSGETLYQHSGLGAVIVHPEKREVFPLEFEAIVKQDGERKNDCERNAAKRLLERLKKEHPDLAILLVEDALYANAPHLRQITGYGWKYILNVKPDSHKSLFKQFEGRQRRGQVKQYSETDRDGMEHRFEWTNQLWLCESGCDVKVNFLHYEERKPTGEVKRWTWITNLKIHQRTVKKVMIGGRARWKIENETFNSLKNQGYHFEHNYGHGVKNLATVLALLMMLAFLVDQIQQGFNKLFQTVWKGLGSKSKLWESVRSLFQVLKFETMESLYQQIAVLYGIQLE
jgi:hypothetical protein